MTTYEIERLADLPEFLFVEIDRRFQLVIERTELGLELRLYPRTYGELWDVPFCTFEVDETEIVKLEQELQP